MATFFAALRRPAWGRRPRQPPGETGPPGLAPADDFQGRRVPPRRAGSGFAPRASSFLCGQKGTKKPLRGANRLSFGTKGVPRTQDLPPKNPRKGYGGVSYSASTAFRRPDNDTAPVPSAAPGLVRACFRKLFRTPSGAWRGDRTGHFVLSEEQGVTSGFACHLCAINRPANSSGLCPGRRLLGCLNLPI